MQCSSKMEIDQLIIHKATESLPVAVELDTDVQLSMGKGKEFDENGINVDAACPCWRRFHCMTSTNIGSGGESWL